MSTSTTRAQKARNKRILKANPVCHICGQAIDLTLRTPHPDSGEVDHKVPRARGGTDDLTNLASSHRRCNAAKSANPYAPIIRRSGALR